VKRKGERKREKGERGRKKKIEDNMWAPHVSGAHNFLMCESQMGPTDIFFNSMPHKHHVG
jgi:hypothetical protein